MGTLTARSQFYKPAQSETGWHTLVDRNFEVLDSVYNVEGPAFGAVPDEYYADGVATSASTTFTSATAVFTAADVGKFITILRAGPSSAQPHSTTIASFTNSTTVELTHAAGRSQNPARFYIARDGDQTSRIQSALDAAEADGGGTVYLPGVGYAHTGLTWPNRVTIAGAGHGATVLRLMAGSNRPSIANKFSQVTVNGSQGVIRDLKILGNRNRQTNPTTTLTAGYTAGVSTTMSLTDASAFLTYGVIIVNGIRYRYTKSGNTLTLLQKAIENGTDANASIGATVTGIVGHGVWIYRDPPTAGVATDDLYDLHHRIHNVFIFDCKGDGIIQYGQSVLMVDNVAIELMDEWGIRSSFDAWYSNINIGNTGRGGYYMGTQGHYANCTAYFAGQLDGGAGWGFMFEAPPPVSDVEGICCLASCTAQDNQADGFFFSGADRVSAAACAASSNGKNAIGTLTFAGGSTATITKTTGGKGQSAGHGLKAGDRVRFKNSGGALPAAITAGTVYYVIAANLTTTVFNISATLGGSAITFATAGTGTHSLDGGTYMGVRMAGSQNCTIDVACVERMDDGLNATQQNAVSFDDVQCAGNQMRIQHGSTTGVTVGPAVAPSSDMSGGNDLTVDNSKGQVTVSFAASFTPNPRNGGTQKMVATANVTAINAPAEAWQGAKLKLIIQQDGTGGRTLPTPNSIYKMLAAITNTGNTASKYWVAEFEYDGTNWLNTSLAQWVY